MRSVRRQNIYKRVIAASLVAGSTFQLAAPVLAITAAGEPISNTATATYEDPNGNTIDATSNTVTIRVAEVAGITVTPNGTIDPNGGIVSTGDIINFDYKITNTGNDPTTIFIPGAPSSVQGGTAGTVQITGYDPDGPDGPDDPVVLATPIDVPAGGILSNATAALGANGILAPGATIDIRVPLTVTADTSGAPISVVMGDTGANDNSAGTQNQPDAPDSANANEIRTVDFTGTTGGEQAGAPVNGEREASAFQQIFLASAPKAFATILKTNTFTPGTNGTTAPNGTITYSLSLDVARTSPDTAYVAAPLKGTDIFLDGVGAERVLVSDVVPTGTRLVAPVATPTGANAGWIPVYSISDPATTTAIQAQWTTTLPAGGAAAVRRVGFVFDPGTTGIPNNDGVEYSGLNFSVTTDADANTTYYNLAQVFGQTTPDADAIPGNGSDPLVYDESGDQQPNNYDGPNDPGDNSNLTPSDFNTTPTESERGVPNPTQGVDSSNNNTGTGPGGEVNPLTLNITPPSILNGPQAQPGAVGPTDNNDDFTNRSVDIPAGTAPGATLDPAGVVFTNTVNNPGTTPLTNVLVRPLPPADPEAADLPDGTQVRITLGNNSGLYEYDRDTNTFNLVSGTPVSIPVLNPGQSLDYTVIVNLPTVGLSTDDTDGTPGFPVPIVAFTDNDGSGSFNTGDNGNVTIDRVYTGYLKLVKEARILAPNGTPIAGAPGIFTTDGAVLAPAAIPGNRIQYRISYKNISEASAGVGNTVLNANNTVITEDGNANGNTWFGTTAADSPTEDPLYPSDPVGTARATAGTIVITDNGGDIEIYVNNVGTVVPSGPLSTTNPVYDGNLNFQRLIK